MNNKLKGYCLKLCKAIKEEEVTEILSQIEKECNVEWKPYGNTKGNYSSFENQQTTAEGALMEKIINSIDHKMIRQCKVKNIDPTSKDAPKTMEEAKNQLFTEEELKNEFINIIVDGEKDEMNVIIHDDGEGQSPENFESTFLSLQTGNKNNIPFVQGKFNMGSTGAVVFCGNNKYQLIVSRRSKVITGKQEKIGYTIVRKHKRTIEEQEKLKNTWYEYLTIDGLIPSFELDKIVLCKDFNSRYTFVNGTVVKLYNYQLNSKTQAFQTLKSTINSLIYEPAFPINVHESRRCFKIVKERKGITNIAWGNRKELEDDYFEQEKIEYISENNICKGENFGEAKIDIYVYKSNVGTDYLNDRRSKKPIVFLMNGQVQYHKSVSYITSELGFKLIKNHLFVVIDCTNLSKDFHDQGFFMANRESIRDTPDNREFINTITKYLKDEPKLKQLNRERAAQQVSSSGTQELFEKLLGKNKQDDFLKDMFKISDYGVKDKEDKDKEKAEDKENKNVSLNEFPTYVKMKGESSNNSKNIEVQQGKGFTLNFEIDAEDNFFKRVDDNGTLKINIASTGGKKGNGEGRKKYNIGNNGEKKWFDLVESDLHDGQMKLTFISKEKEVEVGEGFHINVNISDKNKSFDKNIYVTIIKKEKGNKRNKQNSGKSKLSLPPVILVYKNKEMIDSLKRSQEEKESYKTWEDMDWNDDGGKKVVKIIPAADDEHEIASAIYINMSSNALARIISEEGTAGTKIEFSQEQFMTAIYSNSFLILAAINSLKKKNNSNIAQLNDFDNIEEFVGDIVEEFAYAVVKMQINNVNTSKELL